MRRNKTTSYGERGGVGPNAGKGATKYEVTINGQRYIKRCFNLIGPEHKATAFRASDGKIMVSQRCDRHHGAEPKRVWRLHHAHRRGARGAAGHCRHGVLDLQPPQRGN